VVVIQSTPLSVHSASGIFGMSSVCKKASIPTALPRRRSGLRWSRGCPRR
jgi:hypothetical protein